MKTYSIILILGILLFSGCAEKVCEPEIITRIEIREVKVPVKPERPEIDCEFSGTGNVPITKLLDCVVLQKRIIEELTVKKETTK